MTISPEWLTAIATVGLAATAFFTIFRDEIRQFFRRPKFAVNFEPGLPDCQCVRLDSYLGPYKRHSAETHCVRARVKNVGEVGAANVEVSVVEVRRKGADGNFRSMPMGTPWNLVWAHIGSHVVSRLPVESERHIDIGHVIDPKARKPVPGEDKPGSDQLKTLFSLAFFVQSNTYEYLLDPGEYQIDFQVFASNASASSVFTFHLNHTGAWYDEEDRMYHEGLGLRLPSTH
jgi:hypothetical protein